MRLGHATSTSAFQGGRDGKSCDEVVLLAGGSENRRTGGGEGDTGKKKKSNEQAKIKPQVTLLASEGHGLTRFANFFLKRSSNSVRIVIGIHEALLFSIDYAHTIAGH